MLARDRAPFLGTSPERPLERKAEVGTATGALVVAAGPSRGVHRVTDAPPVTVVVTQAKGVALMDVIPVNVGTPVDTIRVNGNGPVNGAIRPSTVIGDAAAVGSGGDAVAVGPGGAVAVVDPQVTIAAESAAAAAAGTAVTAVAALGKSPLVTRVPPLILRARGRSYPFGVVTLPLHHGRKSYPVTSGGSW